MHFSPLKASLVALALFAGASQGYAAGTTEPGTMVVAQAADSKRVEAVRKFLANKQNIANMDAQRLKQRLNRAQKLQSTPGLPDDLAQGLQQEIAQLQAALAQQGDNQASSKKLDESSTAQQQQPDENQSSKFTQNNTQASDEVTAFLATVKTAKQLDEQALRQQTRRAAQLIKSGGGTADQVRQLREVVRDGRQAMQAGNAGNDGNDGGNPDNGNPGNGQGSAEVAAFLKSVQPASELSEQALRQQTRKAAQLAKAGGASAEQMKQLREVIRDGRQAMQAGNTGNNQNTGNGNQGNGQGSAAVTAFLQSVQPASQLNEQALRQQVRKAAELAKGDGVSAAQMKQLREVIRDGRQALQSGNTGNNQQTGNNQNNQNTGNNQQSGSADQQAQQYLNSSVQGMNKQQLRQRLQGMRDLLQANKLSPNMKKQLRQRLAQDRQALRNAVGAPENETVITNNNGTVNNNSNNTTVNTTINNNTVINQQTVQIVLNDRRPPRDLRDDELERRINVYRRVMEDPSYRDVDRTRIRIVLEQDRQFLRQRLIENRRQREARLRANRNDIDIDLSLNFEPNRPRPPRYVYAAEADEEDLVDVLSAPPRRKLERRYTVEEVESNPDLRDAVARIELDTVHFGFGESFLREEEVDKLDRIAEVMERILAKSPGEIFMIEGHTDAVGSDQSNLKLSRERAKAVKEALTTYYVIPEENLKTVGYGEKYLKIPTEEPEGENRRVSIARITPLVGSLNEQ